jgi:hypothetical protein
LPPSGGQKVILMGAAATAAAVKRFRSFIKSKPQLDSMDQFDLHW